MSFLYKRLFKLGQIATKKDTETEYDFSALSLEEYNYILTIPTDQWETNESFIKIYNKNK